MSNESYGVWVGDWDVTESDLVPVNPFKGWHNQVNGEQGEVMSTDEYKHRYADWEGGAPTRLLDDNPAPEMDMLTDESERAQDDYDRRPRKPKSDKSGTARVRANDRWAARKAKANRERMKTATDEPFIEDKIVAERQPQIDALRVAYERSVEAVDAIASNLIEYPGSPYTAAGIENLQNAASAIGPLGDEIRKWEQHQIEILQENS